MVKQDKQSEQNDTVDIPNETTVNGEFANGIDDLSDEKSQDFIDAKISDPSWETKRIKLDVPAFLQPKPIAAWKSVPVDSSARQKKLGIESICPNICFHFLHDTCVEGENCYSSHQLPADEFIRKRLTECGTENAVKLLRVIIARCPKLLDNFFRLFVDHFADHQLKDDLIGTISICVREQDKTKRFTLFQNLINALMRSGETYKSAMEAILFNLEDIQRDVIDTLLHMNLVDGIGVSEFLAVFQSLQNHNYRFNEHIINRLMYLCTQSEDALATDKLSVFTRLIFNILKRNVRVQTALDKKYYHDYMQLYNRNRNQIRNQIRNFKRKCTQQTN